MQNFNSVLNVYILNNSAWVNPQWKALQQFNYSVDRIICREAMEDGSIQVCTLNKTHVSLYLSFCLFSYPGRKSGGPLCTHLFEQGYKLPQHLIITKSMNLWDSTHLLLGLYQLWDGSEKNRLGQQIRFQPSSLLRTHVFGRTYEKYCWFLIIWYIVM